MNVSPFICFLFFACGCVMLSFSPFPVFVSWPISPVHLVYVSSHLLAWLLRLVASADRNLTSANSQHPTHASANRWCGGTGVSIGLDMPVLGMGWYGASVSLIGDAISLSYQVGIRRLTHTLGRDSLKWRSSCELLGDISLWYSRVWVFHLPCVLVRASIA